MGGERGEIGRGVSQAESKRTVVDDFNADVGKILEVALVETFGIFERPEHVGVAGTERRGENALKGKREVAGGDGIAVRPAGVGAEVKRVNEAVSGNFPALGHAGEGGGGFFVGDGESLIERGEDDAIGERIDDMGIEGGGLVLIAEEESFRAETRLGGGLTFTAGGEQQSDGSERKGEDTKAHGEMKRTVGGGGKKVFRVPQESWRRLV